jgi:integrase
MNQRERGRGRIYLRGKTYWIAYSFRGNVIRESAKTEDPKKAVKFLDQRLKRRDAKGRAFIDPSKEEKWTLDDLEARIKAEYIRKKNRSFDVVERCLKHVKSHFPFHRLVDIDKTEIHNYQQARLDQGAERSTVNLECAYLRFGLRIMFSAGEISELPQIKLLEGENVREGFLNRPEFDAICEELRRNKRVKDDVIDIVRFLYNCAWRKGEAQKLEWSKFDPYDWVFRLSRKDEKTKSPRTLTLVGENREIIERRLAKRLPECPYVFHRNGKPIKRFDRAFNSACKEAELTGIVPHDMRRSAIRNFTKAGVGESEGMSISGHRTNSTYKRYNIIDENLQRQSLERVHEHQQREASQRKVVPIKRQAAV